MEPAEGLLQLSTVKVKCAVRRQTTIGLPKVRNINSPTFCDLFNTGKH